LVLVGFLLALLGCPDEGPQGDDDVAPQDDDATGDDDAGDDDAGDDDTSSDDDSAQTSEFSFDDAHVRFVGEFGGDKAGFQAARVDDLDEDGNTDFLIGAPEADISAYQAGAVYLVYGPASGIVELADADAVLVGGAERDRFGSDLASAGDVDGDGHCDILVSSPYEDTGGDEAGAVYVFNHPWTSGQGAEDASARIVGTQGNYLGMSLSAADLDADGVDDVVLGAPGDHDGGPGAGAVFVLEGPVVGDMDVAQATMKMTGEDEEHEAGYSVACAGDVDGDLMDDVVVGAPSGSAAYLVYGLATGTMSLAAADARLVGEHPEHLAGFSVAAAGDVNGDGYADVLVGAPGYAIVYLVQGPVHGELSLSDSDARFLGEMPYMDMGIAVGPAGDVNGDGHADILAGTPSYPGEGSQESGAAFLFLGPVEGERITSDADATFIGEVQSSAGCSVGTPGDFDGDGLDDVFVGAKYAGHPEGPGEVYLFTAAQFR